MYTSILRPILLYVSEARTLTGRPGQKQDPGSWNESPTVDCRLHGLTVGVTRRNRKRNIDIRNMLGVEPVVHQ